ncbi:hypothetical protein [uncultured Acinetobacter sp.]|uniref:hypothetical protein n=1 Tax=uncultured Acinetobacter sp. TaxID=165433 RepID=UPI00260BE466|nr:hypothetical protein [uncultured Acinetobacter sp.]
MEVVGYLNHEDFLLEDGRGMMVLGKGGYVLHCGDQVILRDCIDEQAQRYLVTIRFADCLVDLLHEDQMILKFIGDRANFQQYIKSSTVH